MSIYVKTPKGIEEVERKAHGLALKPRQMLIMIDGKRDDAALKGIFPPEMVTPILQELVAGGFVCELEPPPPVAAAPKVDKFKLQKEAFTAALYEVMGPDSDNFTSKIDAAKSAADLAEAAANCEEVVAKLGGRKKAEGFARHLREAGIEFVSSLAAGAPSQTPAAAAKLDLSAAKDAMTAALVDAIGPDADQFTGKVDAATSLQELVALGKKYAEVVAGVAGKKRAVDFEAKLRAAKIPLGDEAGAAPVVGATATATATAAATPSIAAVPPPATDEDRLDLARNFMINTTNTFTGVSGSSLVVQLEGAKNLKELRSLFYDWREALEMSAAGKQRLPDLEKRLAALLS